MGAEVIVLANPYTYNFLKGLTHSAMFGQFTWQGHKTWAHKGEKDEGQRPEWPWTRSRGPEGPLDF